MNKIEQIKAEIKRMHQEAVLAATGNETDWLRSRIGTLVDVMAFIESLPEEQPSSESSENIGQLPSEDLEKEIIDWAGKFHPAIREEIQSTAYHFANWQKEQMPVGWISIKDRVPDTTEYVFTCVKMDGVPQCVGFHYYKDNKWWEGYKEDAVGAVEYWMPIPKFKED